MLSNVWNIICEEYQERFATFETIAGAYFFIIGLVLLVDLRYWSFLLPITFMLFGLRLVLVNRIREKRREKSLV